jgi:hypothetical protein
MVRRKTIWYDTENDDFGIGSWGDFYETWEENYEKEHPEDSEEEEDGD